MVLALEYSSDNKQKNNIETVMNSIIEFPLLDRTTQNSVISTTSSDLCINAFSKLTNKQTIYDNERW